MKELMTNSGIVTVLDDDDYERFKDWCWSVIPQSKTRKKWRVRGHRSGDWKNPVYLHKAILGEIPSDKDIDHINGDPLDNRKCNLRLVDHRANLMNRPGNGGQAGFKGVTKVPSGRFQARLRRKGKVAYLGTYDTAEQAAVAYDKAAFEEFGEIAWLNFPQSS